MPKIIRSDGETARSTSDACPECCGPVADKKVSKESVFDENGWYFPVSFKCGNKRCGHSWTEKIVTVSGGLHFQS